MKWSRLKNLSFTLACLGLFLNVLSCGYETTGTNTSSSDTSPPPSSGVHITLTATPSSPGNVTLSWSPVGDQRHYWVYMDGFLYAQDFHFTQQYPAAMEVQKLYPETEYCFKVVAYTASPYFYVGESADVCTITPADTTPPDPPEFLRSEYSVSSGEMSLSWDEATDDAWVVEYNIYRDGVFLQNSSELTTFDSAVDTDSLHCYQVAAVDPSGNVSSKSISSCASTAYSTVVADVLKPLRTNGGVRTSLAVDSSGNAHLSYLEAESQDLFYATNTYGEWLVTKVDTGVFKSPSLAVDDMGHVHICYASDGIYGLKYATNASGAWVVTTVDSYWVGLSPSLAIDSNGDAHISYYDYQNGYLKYTTKTSGVWSAEVIDEGYVVGRPSSIGIDTFGNVHISYYDQGNGDLKYATNASGGWSVSTIDSEGSIGAYNSLAVDGEDFLHVGFYDTDSRFLKYSTNKSGAWESTVLDQGEISGTGWNPVISLDTNDKVHMSYNDWGYGYLRYLTNVSGEWETFSIDQSSSGGADIHISRDGRLHIAYQNDLRIYYLIYGLN